MARLIYTMFKKEEIMRGDESVYLNRWTFFRTSPDGLLSKIGLGDIRIYLHKFTGNDACDLHCHPNSFISIGLLGKYEEEFWNSKKKKSFKRIYKAPFFRFLQASHTHRIQLVNNQPAWTLIIMFPKKREWGFYKWINGKRKWIHWKQYVGDNKDYGACQ